MGLCSSAVQPEEDPPTVKPSKYADLAAWSDSQSNTLAHDPRKVNVLDVTLVSATGLLAMDTNLFTKNSSDPLAKLSCAGQKFTSTVKKQRLDPYWNETFRFPLLDSSRDEILELEVEDYDLLSGNDFMGKCRVALKYLQKRERLKVPLGDRSGAKDAKERGEVELEVTLGYDPQYDYFPEEPLHQGEPNLLMIGVTRGRDLLPMDVQLSSMFKGSTTSDPRASVKIANKTFTTEMIPKTLEPQWHARFEVQVEGPGHQLEVYVEDVDVLSGNDFMGLCSIDLDQYADGKRHRHWHSLKDKSGKRDKKRGQVELVVRWVHEPRLVRFVEDDPSDGPANELCVCVVQGTNLLPMDASGMLGLGKAMLSDPLVKVRLCGDWSSSSHIPKTLKPFWNREFRLPLSDADIRSGKTTLELVVEDHDKTSNDAMGSVHIPVAIARGQSTRAWHALTLKGADGGRVEVQLRCVRNPALEHFEPDNNKTFPKKRSNELRLAVIGAQDLRDEGRVVPSVHPHCAVHLWPFSRATPARLAQRAPTWNATYTFRVPSADAFDAFGGDCAASEVPHALECSVRSEGRVLGHFLLGLAELKDRKARRGWYALADQEASPTIVKATNGPKKNGPAVEIWAQWLYNGAADFNLEHADDDAGGRRAPNLLRVALLCATGAAHDPACCAAKAMGHVARTCVLPSPSPEWHAAFELPVDGTAQFLRVALEKTPGDEFGYATVPLMSLRDGRVRRGWLAVRKVAAPGEMSLGDVFLKARAAAPAPAPDALVVAPAPAPDAIEAPEGVLAEVEDADDRETVGDDHDAPADDQPHWCRGVVVPKREIKGLLKQQWSKLAAARALQQGGHGRVEVAARWVYDASLDHFPDDDGVAAKPNCLRIAVIGGRGLLGTKRQALPRDAHVSVRMGPDVAFTGTVGSYPSEDRPRWNSEVTLPAEAAAPLELTVFAAKKKIASGTFTVNLADKGRHRRWFDLTPTSRCGKDVADDYPPGLDLIMRWSYDEAYDFGLRRAYGDEEIAREPNEVGLSVIQVREKIEENARPPLWRPGRELAPYTVRLKCGPKLDAETEERVPEYSRAVFEGDVTSLRKPKGGLKLGTPLEITVERQGRIVGVGNCEVDEIFSATSTTKRLRRWVSLSPPERKGALAKLKKIPQKTARALNGGPSGAELEVEVSAWVCFNASRTARLCRLERELGHERSRPLVVCWYEVAKGGAVVVAPAPRSLLRPPLFEDGRVAIVEESRHQAVGIAGGRKRRALRPQALFPQGATLRSTPVVRFAGLRGAHACAALSEAAARLEGLDEPFSLRVDHWAGEKRGSFGEAVKFPRDPPGIGRRRRPLPRRGGEWHERYRAKLGDGAPAHVAVARLERLPPDYQLSRRGAIAREVALVALLTARDDVVAPIRAWLGAARGPCLALPFEDRVSLPDHAGGGKGALYDHESAALVAEKLTCIVRDAAAAVAHCHLKNVLHGGVSHDAFVVAQMARGPVLQLTGFELAASLLESTNELPATRLRGYVPAYRSPEQERAAAALAQSASRAQLDRRRDSSRLTAASDVWALGVLALNLFEPRRLRRAQQCPQCPPPPLPDDESSGDDDGPYALHERGRDEPLPRDATLNRIRTRDHFDVSGERARAALDAYLRKDKNGRGLSGEAVRTWLRKEATATLEATANDAVTTKTAAQLLETCHPSARLDGNTLLRHASDPARVVAFLGLGRSREDASQSASQSASPFTSAAPSSHTPEKSSSPASSLNSVRRGAQEFPEGSRSVDSPRFLTPPKTPASDDDDFGTFLTPGGDVFRNASAGAAGARMLLKSASKLGSVQARVGRENLGVALLVCQLVDETFERYPMAKAMRTALTQCLETDAGKRPRDGSAAKTLFAAAVAEASQDDASSKLKGLLRKGATGAFFTQRKEADATSVASGPPTLLRVMLSRAKDLEAVDKSRFSRASSDPLCRLGLVGAGIKKIPRKVGHTSSIKKRNLSPTWEETFDLPAHDVVQGAELLVVLEDHDKVGSNDFLGLVALPLQDIGRGSLQASTDWVSSWYDLLDAKGRADKPRGGVELKTMWVAGQPAVGALLPVKQVTEPIKPARAKLCVEVALGLAAAGDAESARPFLDEALEAMARAAAVAPPSPPKRASRESQIAAALALEAAGKRCDEEAAVRSAEAAVAKAGGQERECYEALRRAAALRERRYHEGHPLVAAARCAVAAQARRCLAPGDAATRTAHERAVAALAAMRGGHVNDAERGAAEVVQMARLGADAIKGAAPDAHHVIDAARRALSACDDAAARDVLAALAPNDVACLEEAHAKAVDRAAERGDDVSDRHFPGTDVVPYGRVSTASRPRRDSRESSPRGEESFSGSEAYTSSGPDDADPVAPGERLHRAALFLALRPDEAHGFDARVLDYVDPTPVLSNAVAFPVPGPTPRPPTPPTTPPPPEKTPRYLGEDQHRPPGHLSSQVRGTFPQPMVLS